ncbi:U-box domain-containing protein 9 [Camellia lanceoleosa]|uniref:U-box domain-containing protein 9 n=1 Tax=Camellia lanceoleosa TaxID=1840588 RepID=A0ACC0F327_9ERIC|nr:U-box domain-containing protein 9 [Camellia lanceoleosa]
MKSILEDDNENSNVKAIDRAIQPLCALKDLMSKKSVSLKLRKNLACLEEFRCPLCKELMRDPVIVALGLAILSSSGYVNGETCTQLYGVLSNGERVVEDVAEVKGELQFAVAGLGEQTVQKRNVMAALQRDVGAHGIQGSGEWEVDDSSQSIVGETIIPSMGNLKVAEACNSGKDTVIATVNKKRSNEREGEDRKL